MTHCIRTAAIAAALGGIFLVGQVNAQTLPQAQLRLGPDLRADPVYPPGPFPGAPNALFCKNSGTVSAKLMNYGNADAGPFMVTIIFPTAHPAFRTVVRNYAGLPQGPSGAPLMVNIPLSAFSGNEGNFEIRVDSANQVKESNEANNISFSKCIKPAG
jgi:hypothetical protein